MVNKALFSSAKEDWETPDDLFEELDREFGFTVDVCATGDNRKVDTWIKKTPDGGGLAIEWTRADLGGVCWLNPPYGRQIGKWIEKAYQESQEGATVVCLLPSRTDTKWFHDWIYGKAEIRFIRGRLKFKGARHAAPFPSMIVIFRPPECPKP